MKISVIVCTYNRSRFLPPLLNSLAEQKLPAPAYEVVLVNNRSTDDTESVCKAWARAHRQIQLSYVVENRQGLSHARNRGIQEATGDVLAFVDDDALVPPHYLQTLYDHFVAHPESDAAGGKIRLMFEGKEPPWLNRYISPMLGYFDWGEKEKPFRGRQYPRGSNMAFRRRVFEQAGGFDVRMGRTGRHLLGGEEKAFFARFRAQGFRGVYLPGAWLYHLVPQERLAMDYLKKQAEGIGRSEAIRQSGRGLPAMIGGLMLEWLKWPVSLLLCFTYVLRGRWAAAFFLLRFRRWVSRGMWQGLALRPEIRKKRHLLQQAIARRLFSPHSIPLDRLLIGSQAGYPLEVWVEISGENQRISVPLAESPYVSLLAELQDRPERLADDDYLSATAYYAMAWRCIQTTGHFMGATGPSELLQWMRDYARSFLQGDAQSSPQAFRQPGHSRSGSPVMVCRIRQSDCYEILDGHHRLAAAWVRGKARVPAVVAGSKYSCLQRMLLRVNQINDMELYQPVNRLEVASWPVVRQCTDRYQWMLKAMETRGIQGKTALDLACSYGWFLQQFKGLGYEVLGVDRDPGALEIARLVGGLTQGETLCERVEDFLPNCRETHDVVLFLSILHHYGLGLEPGEVGRLLRSLDRITGRVLFLDSGQNHEGWFRRKLPEWDEGYIRDMILSNTSFKEVVVVGKDQDNRGKYQNQYQRSLFACFRD